jgi:hypothetical protein
VSEVEVTVLYPANMFGPGGINVDLTIAMHRFRDAVATQVARAIELGSAVPMKVSPGQISVFSVAYTPEASSGSPVVKITISAPDMQTLVFELQSALGAVAGAISRLVPYNLVRKDSAVVSVEFVRRESYSYVVG